MTNATNGLIRYPLAVWGNSERIVDASVKQVAICQTHELAAEIVRVMNAAHEWEVAAQSASDKPAPVKPGEPSREAMRAAVNILKSMGIVSISKEHAYARTIDAAFAPKLAESAKQLQLQTENVQKWIRLNQLTERERDEAMAELKAASEARDQSEVQAGEACVAAAEEFLAGMGEPVDLEEVTIPRSEFNRAKRELKELATLRQQLAERDTTIERIRNILLSEQSHCGNYTSVPA